MTSRTTNSPGKDAPASAAPSESYQAIYSWIFKVPRGRVATYGQIAKLAGLPNGARQVGYALHRAPEGLPWHRVINARGEVSLRSEPGPDHEQRWLLEQEGVVFDLRGRCDLKRYRWRPEDPEAPNH